MKQLIIIALLASATWATDQPTFSEFDLNSDGKITQSELEESRTQRMKQRADEGRILKNAGEGHSFSQIDTNKDGSISEKEFILHKKTHHNQSCFTWQNSAL
ncbi:MAG: EF-hand domain-containing protein [Sulfurovum sp.]|uniref:EF-hand domain-containing protein n=1 Tax=Sulfurovum sp. TaxID=1969726 RepID=UPI002867FCEB|nr:EF-hand domain-containing protein [Sulfurovum sp.]MCO4845426.1 EF-hand domain-containing protein [Sulfurovum sp.]